MAIFRSYIPVLPATRREAVKRGCSKYKTGRLCKHGHDSPRYTTTGACVKCSVNRNLGAVLNKVSDVKQRIEDVKQPAAFIETWDE